MFSRKNLVFLTFTSPNPHSATISKKKPVGVRLNLQKGTWSWREKKDQKFGSSMAPYFERGMSQEGRIIGVYDRTKMEHLDAMVHAACDATKSDNYSLDS